MNDCKFMGRLTKDCEVRVAASGNAVAKFSLAVDRPYSKDKQKEADFVNFTAFGKTAEFCADYLVKGKRVIVFAQYRHDVYTDSKGDKRYADYFVVEKVEPIDWPDKDKGAMGGFAKDDVPF